MTEETNIATDSVGERGTAKKKMVVGLVLVALVVLGSMLYTKNPDKHENVAGEETATTVEKAAAGNQTLLLSVTEKIGRLTTLPTGEQPALFTVSDPEKLRTQPFFDKAKRGDLVLIYQKTQKAFLYDPVKNELLQAATIAFEAPTEQQPSTPQPVH